MISSGEVFLLNGETGGELRPQPGFLNKNLRVIAAGLDRAYVACEPPVRTQEEGQEERPQPCTVWCFKGDSQEAVECPEFETIDGRIRQIAIGDKHLLVLTHEGVVYSRGTATYGCVGHGGARDAPAFAPVPALRGKRVKLVAAGPYYSVAVTHEGDVYSWGQAFQGETGLFSSVEAVPRFAPAVTPFRVTEVSCGHGHVLARTESQQCISWGENTCGQLGLGQKSKPTYKPQLLETIPSQLLSVSAGWAHSVVVGTDGRAYAWGLNSHGQLGLGDTTTRMAPHLLHELVNVHQVQSAQAARTLTVFRTATKRALLCGQVPCGPNSQVSPEFVPRRPGEKDPAGCLLSPMPLTITAPTPCGSSVSELSEIVAYDKGVIGFATSTVYRVMPNLAPSVGGTIVQAKVTGLPFEYLGRKKRHQFADTETRPLVQDTIPAKVRLKSVSPMLDVVVAAKIVDVDTIEFTTPDVAQSPLGSVVDMNMTSAAVQLRVSIDGGFTWTPDRQAAPTADDLDRTARPLQKTSGKVRKNSMQRGLKEFRDDFEANRNAQTIADLGSMVLWITRWPPDGPSRLEPSCAPVTGGTELLLHCQLPTRMPAEALTVKFVCTPLYSVGDAALEASAPLKRDVNEVINPCRDEIARLPLATPLEVLVCGWLDPGGRGVRCISPPMDAESVKFYDYSVELSLDGKAFLKRSLPFSVFDMRVIGLEPNLGPLQEATEVTIKTTGFVQTDIQRVRLDFPKDLRWPSRLLPATFDHTTGEVSFMMPDLGAEVRQRVDEERAQHEALAAAVAAEDGTEPPAGESEAGGASVDLDGGLGGLEVFVELSLNGQNFTEDRIHFTYHSQLSAGVLEMLAPPEGVVIEPPKEDPKAKKGKSVVVEEPLEVVVLPGAKLGVELKAGTAESAFAVIRAGLATKVGDEEMQLLKVVDLPANLELLPPPPPPPAPPDPKDPKGAAPPPAPPPEDQQLRDMLTTLAPGVKAEDLPEGAILYMRDFQVSLNGKCFVPCLETQPMRLEPMPKEKKEDEN
mmetsp:Transcript_54456/g.137504  ORF Transcript_54456/g.137504 Transcript_54456/m.137504 type:complete len:1025 (+) Transcript_54456:128-3202(+)